MRDLFDLSNKCCVVVGAASGIGHACANMIADMGGRVACLGSDAGRLAFVSTNLEGDGHRMYVCDPADAASVCRAIETAAAEMGPFACAVCADPADELRLPPGADAEAVERAMGRNREVFVAFAKALCAEGWYVPGHLSIVAVSSLAAGSGSVSAAVRELAPELAPRGVRLNAVAVSRAGTMPLGRIEPSDAAVLAAFLLSSASGKITGATVPITSGGEAL